MDGLDARAKAQNVGGVHRRKTAAIFYYYHLEIHKEILTFQTFPERLR